MGEITKIQWCHHTHNPWIGCMKVSPGCANCYAEADMDKRRHFAKWGPNGTRVMTSDANWSKPLKWNRDADAAGEKRIVFCSSLADVFEDWTGPMIDSKGHQIYYCGHCGQFQAKAGMCSKCLYWTEEATMQRVRQRLFYELIDQTPNLIWLLLTKRPENIRKMWPLRPDQSWRWDNVWLYTSVENQEQADKRIDELTRCRGLSPVLGLSCEPLLEKLDLRFSLHMNPPAVDHIIVGGESGHDARLFQGEWAESLMNQCRHRIPIFMKQFGSNPYYGIETGDLPKPLYLSDRKGGDPDEWPDGFNIRQMPEVA